MSAIEIPETTKMLGRDMTTLEIAKYLKRNHRTIKKFVNEGNGRNTPKRSHLREVSSRDDVN